MLVLLDTCICYANATNCYLLTKSLLTKSLYALDNLRKTKYNMV